MSIVPILIFDNLILILTISREKEKFAISISLHKNDKNLIIEMGLDSFGSMPAIYK